MNDEYTKERDEILADLRAVVSDRTYDAIKEAMDKAYEIGFEEGWTAGKDEQ